MDDDKKDLIEKTGDAVSSAAETVTEGLKSAGKAVAGAITPKPIKAGNTLIIPSADPSMPPVIVPAKRRMRRTARKAVAPGRRRTKVGKTTRASAGKRSAKSTASRPNAARKSRTAPKTRTTRKTARRPARKTAGRRSAKTARR